MSGFLDSLEDALCFPRICLLFCAYAWALGQVSMMRGNQGATPKRGQSCLGVDRSLSSTHMRPVPRICVEFFLRFASKLLFLLCKLPFFIFPALSPTPRRPRPHLRDKPPTRRHGPTALKDSKGTQSQRLGVQLNA
ncbi:hypothetical protein PIB30_093515 [Stylosanthes scabra]|uniref:Uncharacterized protein n=1 Tax=Stylosanthes scabra TaxID=79078 RepID=A0ABU6UXJ0_9FABA|nr:hypothetical protein [Stylosanthes scabra]